MHALDDNEKEFNDHENNNSRDNDIDDEDLECNYKIKLYFSSIRRTKTHDVVTVDETKSCCIVLKKRRYLTHDLSLPFGYKNE